ncbi:MAG: DUF4129 domain-containing protein [Chloroflexi bacterium]|nr:DUF4129 domain-containing protein [Chloroflexota bacterium]
MIRGISWRVEAATWAAIGMELCWLYVALAFLSQVATPSGQVPIAWLLAVYPFARVVSWLELQASLRPIYDRLFHIFVPMLLILGLAKLWLYPEAGLLEPAWPLALTAALARLFAKITPEVILALVVAFLWWRGSYFASHEVTPVTLANSFQLGMGILLAFLVLGHGAGLATVTLIPLVLAYFLFGLLGVGLVRFEYLARLGGRLTSPLPWAALAGVLAILLVATLAVPFLTPSLFQPMFDTVRALFDAVGAALIALAQFLNLEWFLGFLQIGGEAEDARGLVPPDAPWLLRWLGMLLEWVGQVAAAMIIIGSALWLVIKTIRFLVQAWWWLTQFEAGLPGRGGEPLPRSLRDDLRAFWQWLLAHLRRQQPALSEEGKARAKRPGRLSLPTVRAIYWDLMRRAARMGVPRGIAQTPYEYLRVLARALPQGQPDLTALTTAYVRARYSSLPEDPEEIRATQQRWQRLRSLLGRRIAP